jgi:predicted RNA-binding Zn ribbon-like protein
MRPRDRGTDLSQVVEGLSPEPGGRPPAPGELALVQAFINSHDREGRRDTFASPDAVKKWFVDWSLIRPDTPISEEDLMRTVQMREALRGLALENAGSPPGLAAHQVLNQEAERSALTIRFSPGGQLTFASAGGPLDVALGRILAIVGHAFVDGSWGRLRACARDVCQWVFYDRSRSRSAVWCAMSVCGSREKSRAYYQRSHGGRAPSPESLAGASPSATSAPRAPRARSSSTR